MEKLYMLGVGDYKDNCNVYSYVIPLFYNDSFCELVDKSDILKNTVTVEDFFSTLSGIDEESKKILALKKLDDLKNNLFVFKNPLIDETIPNIFIQINSGDTKYSVNLNKYIVDMDILEVFIEELSKCKVVRDFKYWCIKNRFPLIPDEIRFDKIDPSTEIKFADFDHRCDVTYSDIVSIIIYPPTYLD